MKEAVHLIKRMVKTVKISKKLLRAIRLQIKELEGRKTGGGNVPVRRGKEYETLVFSTTKGTVLNGKPFNTQETTAGSGGGCDLVCNHIKEGDIGIEIKNTLKAEFVQMDVHQDEEGKWRGPSRTRKKSPGIVERYETEINKQTDLYYGNPPNLKGMTREDFDKWQEWLDREKQKRGEKQTKDYMWYCHNADIVRENYRDKGNTYIQINGYGLYHLGEDKCNFGVPKFSPTKVRFRLRCKRRGGKGCKPSSLTLSAWIPAKDAIIKSPYSLDDKSKFPPNLKPMEASL